MIQAKSSARLIGKGDTPMEISPKSQPGILSRFAETLLLLIDDDQQQAVQRAEDVLKGFSARFHAAYLTGMRHSSGFQPLKMAT